MVDDWWTVETRKSKVERRVLRLEVEELLLRIQFVNVGDLQTVLEVVNRILQRLRLLRSFVRLFCLLLPLNTALRRFVQ
jgi:hypothetical protein